MKIISYEHSSPISWKFIMFCFFQMLRILRYHHLVFARTGKIHWNTLFLLIKHSFSSFRDNFERGVALENYWRVEIYTLDKVNEHDMVQGFFPNNNKHVRDNKTTSSVGVTVWQFIDWQVIIKRDPPTLIKNNTIINSWRR